MQFIYYRKCIRHLAVRRGGHIGVSRLTNKFMNLLNCNYLPTFEDFSVLCHENKKYLLELKESLLLMRDRPSMNQNIGSVRLCLNEFLNLNYQFVKWLDNEQM